MCLIDHLGVNKPWRDGAGLQARNAAHVVLSLLANTSWLCMTDEGNTCGLRSGRARRKVGVYLWPLNMPAGGGGCLLCTMHQHDAIFVSLVRCLSGLGIV